MTVSGSRAKRCTWSDCNDNAGGFCRRENLEAATADRFAGSYCVGLLYCVCGKRTFPWEVYCPACKRCRHCKSKVCVCPTPDDVE